MIVTISRQLFKDFRNACVKLLPGGSLDQAWCCVASVKRVCGAVKLLSSFCSCSISLKARNAYVHVNSL